MEPNEKTTTLNDVSFHKESDLRILNYKRLIKNCTFTDCDLSRIDFSDTLVKNCRFTDCDLSGINYSGNSFHDCSFSDCILSIKE